MSHSLASLIRLLQSPRLTALRGSLHELLGTPRGLPAVYFLAPIENFQAIVAAGEIRPRSQVRNIPCDLSSSAMQDRRLTVFLGDGAGGKPHPPVEVHDCLNFFWNPINATLDAYCRNALIMRDVGIQIAILEIPIAALAAQTSANRVTWASSKHNLASRRDNWQTSDPTQLGDPSWPWEAIFATEPSSRRERARKAEFVCHVLGADGRTVAGVPLAVVSRCIVGDDGAARMVRSFTDIQVSISSCFKQRRDLLEKDQKFLAFFQQVLHPPVTFPALLDFYEAFLAKTNIALSVSSFDSPHIAVDFLHGIPHVSRVMFWSFFLSAVFHKTVAPDLPREALIADCLWAASIHDLCRENNQEDEIHGAAAALRHAAATNVRCDGDALRIQRIHEAVAFHCRPDAAYADPSNIVYRVLKDADAIERGRFGGPCRGSDYKGTGCTDPRCSHKGCAYTTLRLCTRVRRDYFRDMAWAGYNLAQCTKFAPWSGDNAHVQLITFMRNAQAALATA
jgi:hypothetical protein